MKLEQKTLHCGWDKFTTPLTRGVGTDKAALLMDSGGLLDE